MSKTTWSLSKVAKSATTGAALASLVALDAVTAGSALAQQQPGQASPTMQRLQQLQQVERNRQSTEDAKWRSFTDPRDATGMLQVLAGAGPKCEFYWPGWKLRPDGIHVTRVRSCKPYDLVAVNCRTLKVAWYQAGWNKHYPKTESWSSWRIPGGTSNPFDIETTQMVAALCDNITPFTGKEAQSLTPITGMQARSPRPPASVAKRTLPMPNGVQFSAVNVGAGGKQILQLLGEMGVETEIRDRCPKAGTVAAYSRFDNLLILCMASLRDPVLATEAIAHEAVHVLQDCLQPGGIKGSASITLTNFYRTFNGGKQSADLRDLLRMGLAKRPKTVAYLEELKKSMTRNMYAMEIEAYALEVSPKTISILLETFLPLCGLPA